LAGYHLAPDEILCLAQRRRVIAVVVGDERAIRVRELVHADEILQSKRDRVDGELASYQLDHVFADQRRLRLPEPSIRAGRCAVGRHQPAYTADGLPLVGARHHPERSEQRPAAEDRQLRTYVARAVDLQRQKLTFVGERDRRVVNLIARLRGRNQ